MYKFTLLLFVVFSFPSFAGSKCQEEWNSYKAVQDQLRHQSYEWLRDKERRKHAEYQDCRKGKTKKKKQKSAYKNYSSQTNKKTTTSKTSRNHILNYKAPRTRHNSVIDIKGYFTGEKQNDWLEYYRKVKPEFCKSPKSTSQFAKCLNNEKEEVEKFKILWRVRNPGKETPSSIVLGHG